MNTNTLDRTETRPVKWPLERILFAMAGTVTLLSDQIAKLNAQLDRATAAKDATKISELTASIATYESWLDQATKTLEDFKG